MQPTPPLSVLRGRLPRHLATLLLAAALLLAAGGEVLGGYACPHHDAPRQDGTAAAHESGGHHAPATDAPPPEPHDGHYSPCTCIGACHVTAATALPPLAVTVAAPSILPGATAIVPSRGEVGVARILLRLLPFANGPPRLA